MDKVGYYGQVRRGARFKDDGARSRPNGQIRPDWTISVDGVVTLLRKATRVHSGGGRDLKTMVPDLGQMARFGQIGPLA